MVLRTCSSQSLKNREIGKQGGWPFAQATISAHGPSDHENLVHRKQITNEGELKEPRGCRVL